MLDEKQMLTDENEKLQTENNQFREIFSVKLILRLVKFAFIWD